MQAAAPAAQDNGGAASAVSDAGECDERLPPKTTLARFLDVRGLERRAPISSQHSSHVKTPPAKQRPLWHSYSKRHHEERTAFCRHALASPDESYSESVDVYNPRKPPTRLIKIHVEADDISEQFLYRARSLFFVREVVDRPVCDLMENQAHYDTQLDGIYVLESEAEMQTDDLPSTFSSVGQTVDEDRTM